MPEPPAFGHAPARLSSRDTPAEGLLMVAKRNEPQVEDVRYTP